MNHRNTIWGFVLRYLFWISILFFLIYFENISPLIFLNYLQTDLSIYLTKLWIAFFEIPVTIYNDAITYTHGFELEIINDCNGLAAFLFYIAGVLAFPSSIKSKIYWGIGGYFILLIANSIRLDWIIYHVIENPEIFFFVHEVIGRYAMASIPLILFYLYTEKN